MILHIKKTIFHIEKSIFHFVISILHFAKSIFQFARPIPVTIKILYIYYIILAFGGGLNVRV